VSQSGHASLHAFLMHFSTVYVEVPWLTHLLILEVVP
jgi:hypothetical protein